MRTTPIPNPERLTDVLTNIINELEQRQQTPRDDFVIQALLALQAMVEHEHDQRKQASLDRGPRIGG